MCSLDDAGENDAAVVVVDVRKWLDFVDLW